MNSNESLEKNGVVLIVNKRVRNAILGCNLKNNRMTSVCFQGKPFNIMVIQVYDPKCWRSWSWTVLWRPTRYSRTNTQKRLSHQGSPIIGHLNAEVGSQEIPGATGKFDLGVKNEAGQRLTEFCQENALVIANTLFQQHKRRLYTWTSPDGQYWNQIDYILCSQRWRSSI